MSAVSFRGTSVIGAGAFLALLLSTTAQAQVTPPSAPENAPPGQEDQAPAADQSGEIVVTGTRIRRPNLDSNSPLTAVSDEEIKLQGAINVENVVSRLPQFTADSNEYASNGASGTAGINLRNLGSNRVLTLVNGQRMLPTEAVDVNFVPSSLVQRIDVVTGGASAVYGSDALSGVVNFILRDNLDGFRIDAQTSFAQHDNDAGYLRDIISARGFQLAPSSVRDAGKQDINAAFGKNFAGGRGNITVYGGYRHTEPVLQSTRDYSACAFALNAAKDGFACGGSSNTTYGTFAPLTGPMAGQGYFTNVSDGSKAWVPYDSSYAYNYSPTNYIQRSDERYTAGAFAKFKITPAAELYGSFMYMKDHTFSQAAPSALFLGTPFTLSCDNPLMSAAQQAALCGPDAGTATRQQTLIGYRLNNEYSRRDDLTHEDFRYTAGMRGDLGKGFSYDLNYLRALGRYRETYLNNVDSVKAQRALDVVDVSGTPTCRSVLDGSDPACVPIDVFRADGITSDQAQYLFSPSNTSSRNTLDVMSANLNGDLGALGIRSPWAGRAVNVALGYEHRHETLRFVADEIAQQGGTLGNDGEITVNEGYGEIEIPIVSDKPFFHELTLNGGVRYSSYSNAQDSTGFKSSYNVWTYKGELSWAPISDLRLRASYNRAIRAPGIGELFGAQSLGNVSLQDPCAGATPEATASQCELTGVAPAQYGHIIQCPAGYCTQFYGGNPALKPETGDTYTIGAVLTPRQLRRFSLSVDYYHIKIKGYIGSISPAVIVSQCIQSGDPYYCDLIHRNPTSGAIFGTETGGGYVLSTNLNTGSLMTSGIDVTADYSFDVGKLGSFNANIVGTWLMNQENEPLPGGGSYDCKGYFGYTCGQPSPTWRHVARLTWDVPGDVASLSLAWRYINHTTLSGLSDNPFLNVAGAPTLVNGRLPSYSYFDLAATASIGKQLSLRMGVNNIADKNPPVIAEGVLTTFGNGNTFPGVYDPLGRTIFFGATVEF